MTRFVHHGHMSVNGMKRRLKKRPKKIDEKLLVFTKCCVPLCLEAHLHICHVCELLVAKRRHLQAFAAFAKTTSERQRIGYSPFTVLQSCSNGLWYSTCILSVGNTLTSVICCISTRLRSEKIPKSTSLISCTSPPLSLEISIKLLLRLVASPCALPLAYQSVKAANSLAETQCGSALIGDPLFTAASRAMSSWDYGFRNADMVTRHSILVLGTSCRVLFWLRKRQRLSVHVELMSFHAC